MLRNAENVVITGGQFTNIESCNHDAVSTTLLQHVAPGAIFDSAERYAAGRCHAGTRKQIIKRITDWIGDIKNPQRVLWLYGSAGAGKSAIMQSICEMLQGSYYPNVHVCNFFFARGHSDRGREDKLFPTLSYQLAIQCPPLRTKINDALFKDPTLPTKSIDIQLSSLLIDPLLDCESVVSRTTIVIIDGLDECDYDQGKEAQRNIVDIIKWSIKNRQAPVRFIIASRPEYWIRDAFESLSDITCPLSLRDDQDADRDIRSYLKDGFEKIRLENLKIMGSVTLPWPPTEILNQFVYEASGQYIYASTVLKFVGKFSNFSDPQKQLRIVATPGIHRAAAFSELDRLYAAILSAYPHTKILKRVLGGLLALPSLTVIQHILGVDPNDITLVLEALSSLVNVVWPSPLMPEEQAYLVPIYGPGLTGEGQITFCHLSFREFLQDKHRSGPYYVDISAFQTKITESFFHIIQRNLDRNYDTEPHVYFECGLQSYRTMMRECSIVSCDMQALRSSLPLFTNMTAKLHHLNQESKLMTYPASLMQEMNWLGMSLSQIQEAISLYGGFDHMDSGSDMVIRDIHNIISELQDAASVARETGLRLLSLSNGFAITPPLLTIKVLGGAEISWWGPKTGFRGGSSDWGLNLRVKDLFIIPGNTRADCLSTLRNHRHIIKFSRNKLGLCMRLMDLDASSGNKVDGPLQGEGWLSRSKWRNQRFFLAGQCLKSLLSNHRNGWEFVSGNDTKPIFLRKFFDDGDVSDIKSDEFFKNQSRLCFLNLIVDTKAWTTVLPSRPRLWDLLSSLISPVLCWFNRQLTNASSLRVMEEHDLSLPQKMRTTMTAIFQTCFVPIFTSPYFSDLIISSFSSVGRSVRINVHACRLEEQVTPYSPPEYHEAHNFRRVHNELFGTPLSTPTPANLKFPTIERSSWYPHLAAYLLNVLVKYLYTHVHLAFCAHTDIIEESFPDHILECLPYAEASQQNLHALRAIKSLRPKAGNEWCPPTGFCRLTRKLLKKYDPSLLSSEEWRDFKLWLYDLQSDELSPELLRCGWEANSDGFVSVD